MNNRRLSRLLAVLLVFVLVVTDVALLFPVGGVKEAQAAFPGMNAIGGFLKTIGALNRRNRVYREAGATAEEINVYYDRLIAQAQDTRREMTARAAAGETNPRFARSYVRIGAALEAERKAAIQMIEAEKNQARREFGRAVGKEITNVLIASPGGQQILGRVRETVKGARDAATAVRAAAEKGRPIEALAEALAKKVGDIPVAQEAARRLGSAVGHGIDRALGGALSRVERAIDNIQGEMGQAIDFLDQVETTVNRYDEQEREPVSLVENDALISKIIPVDRANAAVDVAASAFAGASAIAGTLSPGKTRADMRDQIRGALLDERIEGIQSAVSNKAAGQTYCTTVGKGEYEVAARQLGQTPKVTGDSEKARYLVCYDIQTQIPQYARMFGSTLEETEKIELATEGIINIPAGRYIGKAGQLEFLDGFFIPGGNISENRVDIIVADNGLVTGSLYIHYDSGTHLRDDNITCTTIWHVDINGFFSGQLTSDKGVIEHTERWTCETSGSCNTDGECSGEPLIRQLDVLVSGDQMTGTTLPMEEDPDGFWVWTFNAVKQ